MRSCSRRFFSLNAHLTFSLHVRAPEQDGKFASISESMRWAVGSACSKEDSLIKLSLLLSMVLIRESSPLICS